MNGEAHPVERPGFIERVAALVALTSLLAAVVLVAVSGFANWSGLVVSLLGLLIVVLAGWYVVSRRGTPRVLATCAAAVGAAVLVTGLLIADMSALRIATAFVIVALSIGSARVALQRSSRAMRRVAATRVPVPPARHPVLLVNPRSGGGKAERFGLVDACRERGIEAIVLGLGDDLLELVEAAVAGGADVIGMAGGDGSQALVAEVASRHGIAHVVVPSGTRNHFALDLGLDRNDVLGALDAFHDGVERRVDLATINGRVFVNNASMGLYAKIVQSPEYRDAKRGTVTGMLPELIGPNAPPMDLRFTGPDGTSYTTSHIILVSNNPYELRRMGGRGTRERLDLGVLGIAMARISNAAEFSRFLALEAAGRPQQYRGWLEWAATTFRVESNEPVEVGVDGEALVLDPPVVFESRPGVLRVRTPRRSIGRSPSARAVHPLSFWTVADLARVAAGSPAVGSRDQVVGEHDLDEADDRTDDHAE